MKLIIIGFVYFTIMYINKKKVSPFANFLIVFIVMAFQSNVTGDFYSYAESFYKYNALRVNFNDNEVGWYGLNRLFGFSNFFVFYFFVALFEFYVLSRFSKKYVPKEYWILPAILFFFDMNMMFFQMKGLRQALAIELGVFAIYTIGRGLSLKNIILSMGISTLAFSMHQTGLVVFAYVLFYIIFEKLRLLFFNIKTGAYLLSIVAVVLFYSLYVSKIYLVETIQPFLFQLELGGLEGYFGDLGEASYNILIDVVKGYFVFYIAYSLKYTYGMQRYATMLCLIGAYLDMFLFGMGNLYRVPLYLTIYGIFVYPNVVSILWHNRKRVEASAFLVLSIAYAVRTFVAISTRGNPDMLDTYQFSIGL